MTVDLNRKRSEIRITFSYKLADCTASDVCVTHMYVDKTEDGSRITVNLDCGFQDENDNATICSWQSTKDLAPPPVAALFSKYHFHHWEPINRLEPQEENTTHGANTEHLKGS